MRESEDPLGITGPLPKRREIDVEHFADAALGIHDLPVHIPGRKIDKLRRDIRNECRLRLSLASFGTVNHQPDDQGGLEDAKQDRPGYRPSVQRPEVRLPKFDDAAGWQARLTDAPAVEFSPIVDRDCCLDHLRGNGLRLFTAQDPDRGAGAQRANLQIPKEAAADRAKAEFAGVVAEDRCIGDPVQPQQCVVPLAVNSIGVHHEQQVQDERIRRQGRAPLQDVWQRQVVEPGEFYPIGERLEPRGGTRLAQKFSSAEAPNTTAICVVFGCICRMSSIMPEISSLCVTRVALVFRNSGGMVCN